MAEMCIQIAAPVEEFFRTHRAGRRRMLALTYEFNRRQFEKTFASVLTWPVQVDVIIGQNCEGSTTRARFWRARWAGTFHPKIIYLLANERVCVGLGSANLTSGGLGENLETWRYFVEGEEGHDVLAGARKFLEQLKKEGALPTKVGIEEFILALPE